MKKTIATAAGLSLTVEQGSRKVGERLRSVIVRLNIGEDTINTEIDLVQLDHIRLGPTEFNEVVLHRLLTAYIGDKMKLLEGADVIQGIWDVRNDHDLLAQNERVAEEQLELDLG